MKVLVADDSRTMVENLLQLLENEGYEADTAIDGMRALSLASQLVYDVAIIDIDMPLLNGMDFLIRARKIPGWAKVPVVFLTALHGAELGRAEEFARIWAPAIVLQKPQSYEEILAALKRSVEG